MRLIVHFFLVVIAAFIFSQFSLLKYGIKQGIGQLKIVWSAQPVSDFINDPTTPDSLKIKLQYVDEVRKYAIETLGLKESENYTTIYDQKGEPVLWVVTGAEPYKLKPVEWKFPILGTVPYKGFFDKEMATKELQNIKDKGYDAGVRTVGGWSTLGWFTDPILSDMLSRSYGDLANLIFHELSHATIFVKDSVEFNENLASFIADKATIKFMKNKFGTEAEETIRYLNDKRDEELYTEHILRGVEKLKQLYSDIDLKEEDEKEQLKTQLITKIMTTTDTLSMSDKAYLNLVRNKVPNNTYFLSFMRYSSKQTVLEELYSKEFNNNIKDFISYLKEKHPYL